MDAQTSSSLSLNSNNNGQRRSKKDEALYQQTKLNNLRHLVRRKEEELYRLSSQLELEERQVSQINRKLADRAAHASPTRSTSCVADADDSSPSALVGSEVEASRVRHQRKKALLKETLHKMRAKLDDELASARSLHVEIEKIRQTRLQHRRTVEKQAKRLQKSVSDNAAMVVAAQRAYAERETCLIKLSEIKREHEAQTQQWEDSMDECDKEARALDEGCMRRDQELAELEHETEEALAEARAEERERERELSAHEEVRQRRLALDNDMRVLKEKLGSESVEQLCESFKSTAAKILSLWQKHGEQRSELDRVTSEIGALNEEHERLTSATGASLVASPALLATEGLGPLASASQVEQLHAKEQVVASLCKRMQELLESPLLGDSLSGVASKPEDAVRVDQYNLLGLLGLVESAAVRIARERRAQLVALREASQTRGDGRRISLRQSLSTSSSFIKETVPAPAEADGRKRNSVPKITPPSIEGAGVSRRRITLVQQQEEHGAHPGNDPKLGRKALKGELMAQILDGVQEQMEKIHEEELQARRGERVPDAQTSPPVDRAGRDKQINQWISKRRESALAVGKHQAGRRQTAPATRRFSLASFGSSLPKVSQRRCTSVAQLPAAGASSTSSLAESTASRKSVPAAASKPSVASKSYDSAANKVVSSVKRASSVYASAGAPRKPRVRGNSVVSQLLRPFGTSSVIAGSGQDVLEWVGRSNADPIFSRALAATCLPRLNVSASSPDLGGTSNPAAAGDRVVITNCAPGATFAAESAEAYFGNALQRRVSVPIERDIADIESRLNTLRAEGQQIKENKELALALSG